MSAVVHDHPHGHDHAHDHDHHHGPAKGLMRWVTTTNHKDIGTLYLWFSFIMFSIGGLMAVGIRLELFSPGLQFTNPDF
ncbi:MAG TPA: cytochrome c oxidase subunit I, partial [Burkholderiales bacterium]